MRRGAFLAGLAGTLAAAPLAADATGGLDIDDTPPVRRSVRVLLASGNGFPPPEPLDAASFRWSGIAYRGTYANVALPDGSVGLLNTLPLDAYLYGVVSKEVSPAWPRAAQEAQAIVARTYALGKLRPDRAFDVLPGEADQRYGGTAGETVEGRAAVDATSGIAVTAGPQPARVAFSSCCGGFTADAGDTWGKAYPYLPAHADPYCANAPVFSWRAEIPYDAIARALGGEFAALGPLERIELREPDRSGRPRTVAFVGAQRTFEMRTPDFRARLGYGVVKSTLLRSIAFGGADPGTPGGTIVIEGNGNGHGVGMCQWGARQMAAAGASAHEIVAFYFPTTTLARA